MWKVVLDTNVLVAAIRSSTGASWYLLNALRHQKLATVISVPLILEYEAVLLRPKHLKAGGIGKGEVDIILDVVAARSKHIEIFYLWRPYLRDPQDDMVLEVAVNGNADTIITFNEEDFTGVTERFGIEIMPPSKAVRRLIN